METLSPFAFVTLVTLISGAGGTGLGGLIGALFNIRVYIQICDIQTGN